jgi:hypothetical protein
MKEKILQALKTARGQNTSTSDRTLETLATVLSATITDETAIPAAVEQYRPLLADIAGNISHVAAEAVKNAVPATPPATPPAPPATTDGEPSWFTAYKEKQAADQATKDAAQAALLQKVTGFEQKGTREALVTQARQEFYQKYAVNEVEKALCEKALDLHLKTTPAVDSASALQEGWKTMYEDLRSVQGLGGLTPVGANDGGGQSAKTSAFAEKLIKLGKLPTPTV